MNSKSSENLSATTPVPVYVLPDKDQTDDVTLVDLYRVIVKRKWLLVLGLVFSILSAFGYLYFVEPVYRAEARLVPPRQQDIQQLMIYSEGVAGFGTEGPTPALVFEEFVNNLKSQRVRRAFFETQSIFNDSADKDLDPSKDADQSFEDEFNKNVRVEVNKADPLFLTVSFRHRDPELAIRGLNQFVAFVNQHTVSRLHGDISAALQSEIKRVRAELTGQLKFADQRKRDTVLKLQEALRIAKALGFDTNYLTMSDQYSNAISVNTAELPLYMRGARALQEEIAVLESRKSEEPFIPGFRDLQQKLFYLEGISIDPENISAVTIDQGARLPYDAKEPRRGQIILLALVLGLLIGIFAVFIAEFSANARREQNP